MAFTKRNSVDGNLTARIMLEKVKREQQKRRADESSINYQEWLMGAAPELNWTFPHMEYVASKLDAVMRGEIKRLMVLLPYQHGKSSIVTERFPAYVLERDPKKRIAVAAATADLAHNFSRKIRGLVKSRGIVELNEERQSVEQWLTMEGGGLKSVGTGGQIIGFPVDMMIIDDPVKSYDEANSPTVRDAVWNWYSVDVYSRQQKNTPIILIMTHWNEADLAGRLQEQDKDETNPDYKWTVVKLPAICEGTDPEDYPVKREVGDALCPELHPIEQLKNFQKVLGRMFSAGYQQRPTPLEGDIWKSAWFHVENNLDKPLRTVNKFPNNVKLSQVWDTALEVKQRNDPSAMVEGCMGSDGKIYVAAMVNEKLEFPDLIARMRSESERADGAEIIVEDKAAAKPARQQLRTKGVPVIEIASGTNDKSVRAKSVTHYAESGLIVLVYQPGNLNTEMMSQLMLFPNARHDDLHDCFVYLIMRVTGRSEGWSRETLAKFVNSI
jgi:predicted phage terminase large subunit-like protein